jgi:hypothetical protein
MIHARMTPAHLSGQNFKDDTTDGLRSCLLPTSTVAAALELTAHTVIRLCPHSLLSRQWSPCSHYIYTYTHTHRAYRVSRCVGDSWGIETIFFNDVSITWHVANTGLSHSGGTARSIGVLAREDRLHYGHKITATFFPHECLGQVSVWNQIRAREHDSVRIISIYPFRQSAAGGSQDSVC